MAWGLAVRTRALGGVLRDGTGREVDVDGVARVVRGDAEGTVLGATVRADGVFASGRSVRAVGGVVAVRPAPEVAGSLAGFDRTELSAARAPVTDGGLGMPLTSVAGEDRLEDVVRADDAASEAALEADVARVGAVARSAAVARADGTTDEGPRVADWRRPFPSCVVALVVGALEDVTAGTEERETARRTGGAAADASSLYPTCVTQPPVPTRVAGAERTYLGAVFTTHRGPASTTKMTGSTHPGVHPLRYHAVRGR